MKLLSNSRAAAVILGVCVRHARRLLRPIPHLEIRRNGRGKSLEWKWFTKDVEKLKADRAC